MERQGRGCHYRRPRGAFWGAAAFLVLASAVPASAVVEPVTSPEWWNEVQRTILVSEYEITWAEQVGLSEIDSAWQAPNRAHGFRTYFTDRGVLVVPRETTGSTWKWGLAPVGRHEPAEGRPAERPRLEPLGNRIDYRGATVTEWYLNDRVGLSHGIVLDTGHPLARAQGSVFIDMELTGNLSPIVGADGTSVDLVTPQGTAVVRYGVATARDARGRDLRATLTGFNDAGVRGLRLTLRDEDAVYPLTVETVATGVTWTAEADQIGAELGFSVATAGDVNGDGYSDVIVGAHLFDGGNPDEGAAFVYRGSAAGLSPAPVWTVEADQDGAELGYSVAIAGDVDADGFTDVIVGAPRYDGDHVDQGAAFVYRGSAAGLSTSPVWTGEGSEDAADYGWSVAGAGDVNGDGFSDVIVGAPSSTGGAALVYFGSAAGVSSAAAWTGQGETAGDRFGWSVATAGDVDGDGYADVVIGASQDTLQPGFGGRVVVYHGAASGPSSTPTWVLQADLGGSDLGTSVATAGDVNGDGYSDVVIGAPGYGNGEIEEGHALLYLGSATGLATQDSWSVEGDQDGAGLGSVVASAGDVNGDGFADVVIGAGLYDVGGSRDVGRILIYHGSAAGLSQVPARTEDGDQPDSRFGVAVASAGDVDGDGYADVVVGAHLFDGGEVDEGGAFVFHGSAASVEEVAAWGFESDQEDAQLGWSLDAAGDVNGDGYGDVLLGAFTYDEVVEREGKAWVFHGSPSGLETTPAWDGAGEDPHDTYAFSVATAGDVNGDGYDDVLVGSTQWDLGHPPTNVGRSYVYYGSPQGLSPTPDWTADGDDPFAGYGRAVASLGDVNGDGYADIAIGGNKYDWEGIEDAGRVFVHYGSPSGPSEEPDWTAEGDHYQASLGKSISSAGDVNGDGYSDMIVGATGAGIAQDPGHGFVVAYYGSISGLSDEPDWISESEQPTAFHGYGVGSAGDVNGDGYADVVVSAIRHHDPDPDEGKVYVFHGSPAGLSTVPNWTTQGDQPGAYLGVEVSGGDVNGDGYSDLLIGTDGYDLEFSNQGAVFVFHGSAAGLATERSGIATGPPQESPQMGVRIAVAGDVNGDGYADVLAGGRRYHNPEISEGGAWVFHGNGGGGLSVRPQQRRVDDSAPVGQLGLTDAEDGFRVAVLGRTPFGRGRIKLEVEAKPVGVPYDGTQTVVSATWVDTGTAGAELSEVLSGLTAGILHHWRVRLLYDPVTSPFQQASRWFAVPWNGWTEADLRLPLAPAGAVPDGREVAGEMLRVGLAEETAGEITLSWGTSCVADDDDYEIYEGPLGDFTGHVARACTTEGATSSGLAPMEGDAYYLVVPRNAGAEGSYGLDSEGQERPQSETPCLIQSIGSCR